MVNKILRAGNNHEKEYEVVVDKPIDERFVKRMASWRANSWHGN